MRYQGKYDIDAAFVSAGPPEAISWKTTGCGQYVIGSKGGKKYFIKRFSMSLRYPSKDIAEPAYSQQLEAAKWLEQKQAEIKKRCAGLSVDTDHIVVEEDNFWDENIFVLVSRMIDNENVGGDYTSMDLASFLQLCRDLTVLIQKIHAAGITHGDLKVKNILIANEAGRYVPYLIDFDSSYPSDYSTRTRPSGKPMVTYPIVFSPGYESPEIAWYNYNEEGVVPADTLTNKTDIFTLALIFHMLWTNTFPSVEGGAALSVGEAVYSDIPVKLDKKFDIPLGSANGSLFSTLLNWMLQKDSAVRPTADQVLAALNDTLEVDDEYAVVASAPKFDTEAHNLHKTSVDILDKEALKALGVKAFMKVVAGGEYLYYVKLKDGSESNITVDEVISRGYGVAKAASICELWPEDTARYELVDAATVSRLGIISVERRDNGFKHFYYVVTRSGISTTMSASGLMTRGIVTMKPEPVMAGADVDTPWPEHGKAYDGIALMTRGILKVERFDDGTEHKYKLIMSDKESLVKGSYMKLMGFIK